MSNDRTVLFVCLHGAGMSRMAAAYFNRAAPPGWRAVSAGVEPDGTLSATSATLLAGTGAEEFLDHAPPRSIDAVPEPRHMVALRNPAVRYELESTERWDLSSTAGIPLRDELRGRAEALARTITEQQGEGP
ncbi:MAG TPA: hypothetical protein VGL99_13420 [Chloroflexota bacterium]|jgi:hypothetical protein